jgi:chromosomal replication initiator protein
MMEFDPVHWEQCKHQLAARLPSEDVSAWLDSLRLLHLDPDRIALGGIPNSFFKSRIQKQFRALLLDVMERAFPNFAPQPGLRLDCRLAEPEAEPRGGQLTLPLAEDAAARQPAPGGAGRPAAENDAGRTLASLVEGAGNRLALDFARQVVREPGRRFNPLFVAGPSGLGKTHLLQAIAHELRAAGRSVLYASAEAFKVEVLEAIQARRMKPVRDRYRAPDVLLLDDLQFLLVTPKAQEELLHTFDILHGAGKQLVFSADRGPQALTGLNETLRSRLEMGLVTELAPPDPDLRLRILQARAAQDGVNLPAAVAEMLAERLPGNPRQIVGVLVRLAAYSGLLAKPITLEFALEVAAPFLDPAPATPTTPILPEAVLSLVCERMGVAQKGLRGRDKSAVLVRSRQVTTYLLRDLAGLSYSQISRLLGGRVASTLSHGYHTLLREMAASPHLRRMVLQLRQDLADDGRVRRGQRQRN